ncbi:MAG TPA: glycine zipper domain-containing protein, partial [Thiobacillaceae bacterium]|nr:glycine zipper domain-containing protein [Thiobacillaceae bacterium]
AVGGAAGAAVGQSVGGKSGAVIGAGVGGAAGATVGKSTTENDKPAVKAGGSTARPAPVVVRVEDDDRDDHPGKKHKHKKHPPGHAYGHDKQDRD